MPTSLWSSRFWKMNSETWMSNLTGKSPVSCCRIIRIWHRSPSHQAINTIHLRAAELHFRYFMFLGSTARSDDLIKLFLATTSFLGRVLDLETSPGELIGHSTNYILQMIVSAAFALMKLLKSSFSRHLDFNHGKLLFNGAISAIRRISVMDHDRPIRLADILAQMWNATSLEPAEQDALQLKVRCRMSMSHVYDTVWRWRQRFRPVKSLEEMQGRLSLLPLLFGSFLPVFTKSFHSCCHSSEPRYTRSGRTHDASTAG